MSECRSCGAKIIWIRMQSGKAMPCNPLRIGYTEQPEQPDSVKAVLTLITPDGRTVRGTYEPGNQQGNGRNQYGYISHFSTCPNANKHRRPRK